MNKHIPNINYTLSNDICTGCGVCEDVCPKGAISTIIKDGRFLPIVDNSICINLKGCHRCHDVCPGIGVNLASIAKECFTDTNVNDNKMCGKYIQCFTGYSKDNDIRYHSASGGMVSAFLIWLLENDKIDGAVVTRFDKNNSLLVKSFIATTREEIISARSSKYSPVSLYSAAKGIKAAPGTRYVVVGLPCHIQGFRKLMAIDKALSKKIVGLFAIYCSCGRTFYLTENIFKERGIDKNNLTYFQYRDEGCLGKMVAKAPQSHSNTIRITNSNSESVLYNKEYIYKEHFQSYYHPLRSFFIPRRCLFCIDHYGELGDISFGDIHIPPYSDDKVGVNSLIVRKQSWLNLLLECKSSGIVHLDEISFQTISDSQRMSFKKKGRNGAFVNMIKKFGMVAPNYDVDYLRQPTYRDYLEYFNNRFQQFLGRHKILWPFIKILKSKVNIH